MEDQLIAKYLINNRVGWAFYQTYPIRKIDKRRLFNMFIEHPTQWRIC